jgi:hypothetical protein
LLLGKANKVIDENFLVLLDVLCRINSRCVFCVRFCESILSSIRGVRMIDERYQTLKENTFATSELIVDQNPFDLSN